MRTPPPRWLPDPQEYAIEIERFNHDQALAQFGEYAVFVLLWTLEDFTKGIVARCSICYQNDPIAETYGQSSKVKCSSCFGTTFEGGYKAIIVRLSMWDHNEKDDKLQKKGHIDLQNAQVQYTSDFRARTGDYVFRGDGTRWRIQSVATNHLRTGFMMTSNSRTPLGFNSAQVILDNEKSSVAYMIPPDEETLRTIDRPRSIFLNSFPEIEDIRGSLTHDDEVIDSLGDSLGDSP